MRCTSTKTINVKLQSLRSQTVFHSLIISFIRILMRKFRGPFTSRDVWSAWESVHPSWVRLCCVSPMKASILTCALWGPRAPPGNMDACWTVVGRFANILAIKAAWNVEAGKSATDVQQKRLGECACVLYVPWQGESLWAVLHELFQCTLSAPCVATDKY